MTSQIDPKEVLVRTLDPIQRLGTSRVLALAAAAVIAIGACGGSPSTTASGNAASPAASSASSAVPSEAAISPAATAAPAAIASESAPANPPGLPAIFSSHADPGLEAQLPSSVSGTTMARYSISFAELLASGADRASIDAFLQGVGKTEADGSFAVAMDPTNTMGGGILAFKVSGVDTAALLAGILAAEQSDRGGGTTTSQGTVGGKSVTILSQGTGPNDTEWIYGRGDVVFVVDAVDETAAAAYLQALP